MPINNDGFNLIGTDQDDILRGTSKDDTMIGGAGNDELFGYSGADVLNGTDETARGAGEVDYLKGGRDGSDDWYDTFVLGDIDGAYYSAAGDNDYAIIDQFRGNDKLQLWGEESDYIFNNVGSDVEIRLVGGNELIAKILNFSVDKFDIYDCYEIHYLGKQPDTASLGDFVFLDSDGDGIQDAGESGVENVSVNLLQSGQVVATTTTAADGSYLFDGLIPGNYQVEFVAPDGFEFTTQDAGGDDAADSDADASGLTQTVTLTSGENNLTLDAGLVPIPPAPASLGDFVFHDRNANGNQDAGEEGIAGAIVNLLDNTGTEIGSTTTDVNGNYSFDNLAPGDYTVEFETPTGFTESSPANQGANDTVDSDGTSVSTNLEAGENDITLDSGFYNTASLGDFVFLDSDGDGIQDAGESGVENVSVNLLQNGQVVATTTTAADGSYLFDNLIPGNYQVEFVAPDGFEFTTQDAGGDDAADSDADASGLTQTVTLTSGENNLTLDAGLVQVPSGPTVCQFETVLEEQAGSTDEHIDVRILYDGDFNEDGLKDIMITFSVAEVSNSGTEDMIGTAFDIADESLIASLSLTIDDIQTYANANAGTSDSLIDTPVDGTNFLIGPDEVSGNNMLGVNIAGGGLSRPYDTLVKFNEGGQGDGIVQKASFVIAGAVDLTESLTEAILEQTDWYVRLQSTDGGNGSAKTVDLIGELICTPVEFIPEDSMDA